MIFKITFEVREDPSSSSSSVELLWLSWRPGHLLQLDQHWYRGALETGAYWH